MLQFEVNASVLKTTSFIFSLTPDTASLRTAIENLEASRSSPKCFFTGTKFSALTHAYSRNQQFLAFCIKVNIFLFESILYFTIDAVVNVEAYHRMIIIFRVAECSWPWARLQGGLRALGIQDTLVVTPKLAARFSTKVRKMQHQIESAEQHRILQYFTFLAAVAVMSLHYKVVLSWSVNN